MNTPSLLASLKDTLASLATAPLASTARSLLATLGYQSQRWLEFEPTPAAFCAMFDPDQRMNPTHARLSQWLSVAMLAQITGEELATRAQLHLDLGAPPNFNAQTYQSLLFFAVDLAPKPAARPYTRGELATITREINKLFLMPVSVIFRYDATLTLAIVTHRPHRRDANRDVLEKVSLIRDLDLSAPHRAHLEILADLSLPALLSRQTISGFADLQRAWARTLDSSELNRRFYREIANWYFWAVQVVEFPDDATPRPRRNADRVIRLITRLIFIWFLREKGLVDPRLFRRAEVADLLVSLDDAASSYYLAILQNLFFGTLNQEMRKRAFRRPEQNYGATNLYRHAALFRDPQAALTIFARIPFLNGGLFECLDDVEQKPPLRIDGFSDRPDSQPCVPNALFFTAQPLAVDLNSAYGTRGRRYEVRGLLEILESYKFTVAENTPIEEDVALDPELLGQVFENLLAAYNPETETTARKETGSFYTPRHIVAYMVDESLLLYLQPHLPATPDREARLRELLAYNDLPPRFSPDEIALLIRALDSLTMIDPACGSGAFPMGALQKLVFLLNKLDPGNHAWKARQIARAQEIEDTLAREAAIESIEEAFERNDLDYGRKLFLIENVIYGVDIQPIAVQIAKLRCFISLIVEQQVHDERDNRGIRPLPNLETKFVAADALHSLTGQGALRSDRVIALEHQLKQVRSAYFSAKTPPTKRKYREQDRSLRQELQTQLEAEGMPKATAAALAEWDPYAQNRHAPFFDPEWMFGREQGFALVIANPPYVRQEQIKERKPALQQRYTTYTGTADLYVYFYERGVQLLKPGGILTFISSNKFFRAGYGKNLRSYLKQHTHIQQIIDFGDAPIFTAIAYPSIIIAQKHTDAQASSDTASEQRLLALNWNPASRLDEFPEVMANTRAAAANPTPSGPLILQRSLSDDGWRLEGAATQRLLEKLRRAGKPLGEYVGGRFYRGILTGFNEAFVVDRATRDRLIAAHPSSAEVLKPFLRGRDVKRWRVDFAEQYLIKIESSENTQHPWSGKPESAAEHIFASHYPAIHSWFEPLRSNLIKRQDQGHYFWELRSCAYWQEFEQAKIVYPDIYEHQSFSFDRSKYYAGNTCYFIPTEEIWMCGLLNSTAIEWFYSFTSNRIRGGYLRAFSDYMKQLPIPPAETSNAIGGLVERILALKGEERHADVGALEREINERVYALYGLRPDEIRMIEEIVGGGEGV
ncbi:Eco57I restriction-modification methylase domain-containing protein [Candidatus Oscillochloris fontis]|uniref:Eco57I restriction-modification methylase domain-containing protein n=1 Tax=Candidatus Oscillochloris fontis TaxID=2496868 RepID=UPI00101D8349|nr:TaqI-like C-terminal specificity domain-containing protein [Candidatus Oscillochloris fontis]